MEAVAEKVRAGTGIRIALPSDGDAIQALLEEAGMAIPGINWKNNRPYWAVAVNGEEVVGCIQIVGSLPVGYLSFMAVTPRFQKSKVAFGLASYAIGELRKMGVQAFMFAVKDADEVWQETAKKVEAVMFDEGFRVFVRNTMSLTIRNGAK